MKKFIAFLISFVLLAALTGCSAASVTNASVDENGHLILSLSDGKTIDAGLVKGDKGDQGEMGMVNAAPKAIGVKPDPTVQPGLPGLRAGMEQPLHQQKKTLQIYLWGRISAAILTRNLTG